MAAAAHVQPAADRAEAAEKLAAGIEARARHRALAEQLEAAGRAAFMIVNSSEVRGVASLGRAAAHDAGRAATKLRRHERAAFARERARRDCRRVRRFRLSSGIFLLPFYR